MTSPLISVVLPAYNAARYIRASVDSILTQTYTNFELIVINDGSSDTTSAILNEYSDPRMRVIHQKNQGLVHTLNKGIKLAKGTYIARQDADDRSEPRRLEQQMALIQALPGTVLCGTSMQVMDMAGTVLHAHYVLLNNAELKQELLVRSPFAHGSTVFLKAAYVATGGYSPDEWPAEDYGLWLRLARQGNFANINEPLYVYRENNRGISQRNADKQLAQTKAIRLKASSVARELIPANINTEQYKSLEMGQFRITRITRNVLSSLGTAIAYGDATAAVALLRLLFHNRDLRRKCVRLLMIKVGLKHE